MEQVKLGSYVYVYFKGESSASITREFVIALGKDIFVHTGCFDTHAIEDYRQPLKYGDYGKTWFKTLKEVENKYGKLEKLGNNYWGG